MSITAHRQVTTAEAALDSPGTHLAEIEMVSSVRPLLPRRLGLEDADAATWPKMSPPAARFRV
jgi:hypothetical protein